jgi:hypothetical protein
MFRCGTARELGFDSRDEPDPLHPDNHAHAHVYMTEYNALSGNRRKALAKRLCLICSRVNGD